MKESTNNYNATNGRYIGKYQLDASYLNGDYSPENQERVADQYVAVVMVLGKMLKHFG